MHCQWFKCHSPNIFVIVTKIDILSLMKIVVTDQICSWEMFKCFVKILWAVQSSKSLNLSIISHWYSKYYDWQFHDQLPSNISDMTPKWIWVSSRNAGNCNSQYHWKCHLTVRAINMYTALTSHDILASNVSDMTQNVLGTW